MSEFRNECEQITLHFRYGKYLETGILYSKYLFSLEDPERNNTESFLGKKNTWIELADFYEGASSDSWSCGGNRPWSSWRIVVPYEVLWNSRQYSFNLCLHYNKSRTGKKRHPLSKKYAGCSTERWNILEDNGHW